jgi:hypothetical protein
VHTLSVDFQEYYMKLKEIPMMKSSMALTLLSLAECVTYIIASFLGDYLKDRLVYVNVISSSCLALICIVWPFIDVTYILILVIAIGLHEIRLVLAKYRWMVESLSASDMFVHPHHPSTFKLSKTVFVVCVGVYAPLVMLAFALPCFLYGFSFIYRVHVVIMHAFSYADNKIVLLKLDPTTHADIKASWARTNNAQQGVTCLNERTTQLVIASSVV